MLGPYCNAPRGPKDCPWGGPTEGYDNDYFFLVRGDEDRIYDTHTWGDEEWEEWNTKMEADYDAKQQMLDESKKRRARNMEYEMKSTIVLMPRKLILKSKYEVDKEKRQSKR